MMRIDPRANGPNQCGISLVLAGDQIMIQFKIGRGAFLSVSLFTKMNPNSYVSNCLSTTKMKDNFMYFLQFNHNFPA